MSMFSAVAGSGGDIILGAVLNTGVIGYSNGAGTNTNTFGALNRTLLLATGFTINAIYNGAITNAFFNIEGNHTGNQFTSIEINGTTLTRAGADTPNGTYDAGTDSTGWQWTGSSWSMANGVTYPVKIA